LLSAVPLPETVRDWRSRAHAMRIDAADATALLTHALGCTRAWLAAHGTDALDAAAVLRIDAIFARRAAGEPVAYITGEREFFSRMFVASPAVLIPRPETELLVEFAVKHAPHGGALLDIGTGSGCVAISIACERPDLAVHASDISPDALKIARLNATRLNARVTFAEGDLLAPWRGRRFDLIVSNPPYVRPGDAHLGAGDLRFEPRQALTDGVAGADGLHLIARMVQAAPAHLQPGGWLALEHGFDQAARVRALLEAADFSSVRSLSDLAGHERMSCGQSPQSSDRSVPQSS
jgi:release factor glutamine methyltransferase